MTEIDSGYFDKLLVAPIRRTSLILGRLGADLVRGHRRLAQSSLLAGLAFGAHIESGPLGAIVLVLLASLFGVAYAGFGILVALTTRNVQATNTSFLLFFPLLFLTPNFVPVRPPLAGDGDARADQPGELRDRRPALPDHRRLGGRQDPRLHRGDPGDGRWC